MKKCVECHKENIVIKKWKLCQKCYARLRYTKRIPIGSNENTPEGIRFRSEIDFAKNFFTHKQWVYQPATFRLNNSKYTPDFYDGERGVFIEVIGTQQAYSGNKDKYNELRKIFSLVLFEIRNADGSLAFSTEGEKVGIIGKSQSELKEIR